MSRTAAKRMSSGFNWQQYTRQYNKAVDMVAASIAIHRDRMIPVKAIHLTPEYYSLFKIWVEKKMGRELQEGEKFEFDTVNIELGTTAQRTPLLIELWSDFQPQPKAKMGIA